VETEPAGFAYPPGTDRPEDRAPRWSGPPGSDRPEDRAPRWSGPLIDLGPGWSRAGAVTGLGDRPPEVVEFGAGHGPVAARRRILRWFGGAAGLILVIGLVVLLGMAMTGSGPLSGGQRRPGPSDFAPPLAKACPPPSADAQHLPPAPPPPPGPRTVDARSGISYAAQGDPWVPWFEAWDAGDLHVRYGTGQHFVTERYLDGGSEQSYHASILSGSVPTAENDALSLDLKCTGHQVLADVRASYYPQPNTIQQMRDEVTVLGGRPAWVATFRLHFHQSGLTATSELVGLALIDVGRPNAAILYISIPSTHSQYDHLVNDELTSVRPA
jgi:hypothetical protein